MNNTAEQSAPQESEVLNQGARSENYMARFLTQTSDAFDSTKPFILGSPDPLKITPDKLQILDRYTLDYASNYWSGGEKKAMTHDQKLQEFGSKWANAITKRYALPKEGEAIYVAELNRRKDSGEVLKKLGLDPENMSVDAVRKFHDENFANGGRDVNAFISKVKQSLSPEEMRAHLDDIEFVARMFDRETAKDIRALIELDLDANKDNYAKRANSQGTIRSDEEKRRLQQLAKYLKRETNDGVIKINSEPAVQVKVDAEKKDTTDGEVDVKSPKDTKEPTPAAGTTAADIEITGTEDKPTVEITDADLKPEPVLEVDVPAAQPGQDDEIEIIKEDEEAKAKIMKLPELSDKQQEEFNKLTKEQKDLYISTRDVFNTQLEAIRVKYANNSYNSPINMTKHFKQTNQGNNGRWSCVPASIINATRAIGLPVEDNENQIVDKLGGYDAIGFLKLDKAHSYLSEYLRGTGYMSGGAISPMEIVKTLEDKGVWIANYGRHAILVSGFEVASDGGFWFRVNDPLSDEMVRVPVSGLYEKILDDLSKGRDIRGVILKKVPEQVAADPEIAKQVELV